MDILEFIKQRRSTRKFSSKELEMDKIEAVVEAGRYAPTGGNHQSVHFMVVTSAEVMDELEALVQQEFAKMEIEEGMYNSMKNSINRSKEGNYVFHYDAPVLIITANKKYYGNGMADSACALENMMLMANALDLGSCYINQLKWLSDNVVIENYLYSLGMRQDETVYGALALGYADTEDGLPNRKYTDRTGMEVTIIE